MKYTEKTVKIDSFLSTVFGCDRTYSINNHICTKCGKSVNPSSFKDAISIKEYGISGFCQECQDEIFTENKEDFGDDEF